MNKADGYFLFGCVPFRLLVAMMAYHLADKPSSLWLRRMLIAFGMIETVGIMWYYVRGPAGLGFTPEHVWWHRYRPIHAFNYLMFTVSMVYRLPHASAWLFWDILFGVFLYGQRKVAKR